MRHTVLSEWIWNHLWSQRGISAQRGAGAFPRRKSSEERLVMCLCFSPSLRDCPPLPGRAREALAVPLSFTWYFDSQTCALIGVPHPGPWGGGPPGSWQMVWRQWVLHSQVLLPGLLCPHLPASLCVHFVVLEAPKGKGRPLPWSTQDRDTWQRRTICIPLQCVRRGAG